eukprot:UN04848
MVLFHDTIAINHAIQLHSLYHQTYNVHNSYHSLNYLLIVVMVA